MDGDWATVLAVEIHKFLWPCGASVEGLYVWDDAGWGELEFIKSEDVGEWLEGRSG